MYPGSSQMLGVCMGVENCRDGRQNEERRLGAEVVCHRSNEKEGRGWADYEEQASQAEEEILASVWQGIGEKGEARRATPE